MLNILDFNNERKRMSVSKNHVYSVDMQFKLDCMTVFCVQNMYLALFNVCR